MNAHRGVPLLAALAALLFTAPAALATDHPVNSCSDLQAALNAAGDYDTVTIASGLSCSTAAGYTLPSHYDVVIQGAGSGATIGGATSVPSLHGTDVHDLTLRNLTITGGNASSGAGVLITGASGPIFDHDTFSDNVAANNGGAILVSQDPTFVTPVVVESSTFTHNTATTGTGGAISYNGDQLIVRDSTFTGNGSQDAGGAIAAENGHGTIAIDRSTFSSNTSQFGGALGVEGTAAVLLHGDTFTGNQAGGGTDDGFGGAIDLFSFEQSGLFTDHLTVTGNSVLAGGTTSEYFGGGMYAEGYRWFGHADKFTGNKLPAPNPSEDDEGGGFAFFGCGNTDTPAMPAVLDDAVVAGNSIAGAGEGAGAYVGCGPSAADLTLSDSTVAGNSTSGGGTAGIAGDPLDNLTLKNSILFGNTGGDSTSGFATKTASHSDACAGTSPLPGAGNICADPKLVSAATGDVRETAASPTIDAGDNTLVPAGVATDAFDLPRVTDSNRDGSSIVDMGAAELPTPAAPAPPIPAPVIQTGISVADLKALLSSVLPIKLTGKFFQFVQAFPGAGSASWTLKLGSHKLAGKTQSIPGARLQSVKLKFGKSAQKRLKKVKKAKLTLQTTFKGTTVTKTIRIRKSRR